MALIAEHERKEEVKVEAVRVAPNLNVGEGKSETSKGKGLMAEDEDILSQDDSDGVNEHLAFLSRRFIKLKFKKNTRAIKPNRNMVDKSKFKYFKCGMSGHFANECRKPSIEKKKFEPIDYKKKYFELLKQK